MRHIVGLDLGPNSIGWASILREPNDGSINAADSRIIPMTVDELNAFQSGNTQSKAKSRREKRSPRRMRERFLLRRERLHRILNILGFLPEHYRDSLGWDLDNDRKHFGTFLEGCETKMAWKMGPDNKAYFLFEDAFHEMVSEFKTKHPEIKNISHDWTIYYLRKKALTRPITREQLAWIILQFNQKRGYELQRDERLTTSDNKVQEYKELKVKEVEPIDQGHKGTRYRIQFEDSDLVYERDSKYPLNWEGKAIAIIVTTNLNEDGTTKLRKDGNPDISISMPDSDAWKAKKLKTEQDLRASGLTVGEFIYNRLLESPDTKIRGNYVHTIERDYYKDELKAILKKQAEFIPELTNRELYAQCIEDLYKNNTSHRTAICKNDFTFLILEDILYYQRPGGNNKNLIANCPYESHQVIDQETGEIISYPIPCVATSNPLFQEFRVWKFICDLRIIKKAHFDNGHYIEDKDVTIQFFDSEEKWEALFQWLYGKAHINQVDLLTHIGIASDDDCYRWNYVEDRTYPLNRTRASLMKNLRAEEKDLLINEVEAALWHLLYSTRSMAEINKSLSPNTRTNGIYQKLHQAGFSDKSIESFKKIKLEDEGYAAYSAKAIQKLLTLMRRGNSWSADSIDDNTRTRITDIINKKGLEAYPDKVKKRLSGLTQIQDFSSLPDWLACYVIYGRHSEASDIQKWTSPKDINAFLANFRQHSLNNPVVESVVCETLRVVRDIWIRYGKIDEFHIELGRDLKSPKEKRIKLTNQSLANEATNIRIKRLLAELQSPTYEIHNVLPYSPYQRELLHLYEEGVINHYPMTDEIKSIQKKLSDITKEPSHEDFEKYKCWLDQKYISPYTGQFIPLSTLFTEDYQIEHIIPKAKFFDDSISNKVICETEVNRKKGDMLALNFIHERGGEAVPLSGGRIVNILREEQYVEKVNEIFSSRQLSAKRRNLLLNEIPESFTKRQLNDTRYISKLVMGLLSNIVREVDDEGNITEKEATSKYVIPCNGHITTRLKRDWGMNDVWNHLVLPRFERLNRLTGLEIFTTTTKNGHVIPTLPLELQKGFDIKRIDHRHHAMDAIVIACTTREHVKLINNEYARSEHQETRSKLSHQLRRYEEEVVDGKKRKVPKEFYMPWTSFKFDAATALNNCIISFKHNLRILNKAHNVHKIFNGTKVQTSVNHFAIRKSLHQETFYGHVNLKRVKEKGVSLKVAIEYVELIVDIQLKNCIKSLLKQDYTPQQVTTYFKTHAYEWKHLDLKKILLYEYSDDSEPMVATRFGNDLVSVFKDKTKIEDIEKRIQKISDTGIQKILIRYFHAHKDNLEYAISSEGFNELNEHITVYNNDKPHQPIYKVRLTEPVGKKFTVGDNYNTQHKYVQANDGTNLFFAVYVDEEGRRSYKTIPLYEVISKMKLRLPPVDEFDEDGNKLLFSLSPDDLVYVPTSEEQERPVHEIVDKQRIYRFVDSSGTTANFVPHSSAAVIFHPDKKIVEKFSDYDTAIEFCQKGIIQDEYGVGSPQSKNQKAISGEMIKEVCIPIKVDRLGYVVKRADY